MGDSDRLEAIHKDVKDLGDKVDRLLVGENGQHGLIDRVARIEERQTWLSTACVLVSGFISAIVAYVTRSSTNQA